MSKTALVFVIACAPVVAQLSNRVMRTLAGGDWTFQADGQPAVNAPIGSAGGVAVDPNGNIYIGDNLNMHVFRVSTEGTISIVAGNGIDSFTSATTNDPRSITINRPRLTAVGPDGSVYFAQSWSVRRIFPDGRSTMVVGMAGPGDPPDGAVARDVSVGSPTGLAVDSEGNVYVADSNFHRIRKVSPDGILTNVAGSGVPGFSADGAPAKGSAVSSPRGLAFDAQGRVYFAEAGSNRIRRIEANGELSTFAGGGTSGADAVPAKSASMSSPIDVEIDAAGVVYILENGARRLRRVGDDGLIRTVAGAAAAVGFAGDGGPATSAIFNNPLQIAIHPAGDVLVADADNGRIRRVTGNIIRTIAGNGLYRFSPPGSPATITFYKAPTRVAVSPDGLVYIGDSRDLRISRIERDGRVTLVAGNGFTGLSPAGPIPALDSPIPGGPQGMAFDSQGRLYFGDNNRIRRLNADGMLTSYAGGGNSTGDGVPASSALLAGIRGIAFDAEGNLFFAEVGSHRIRRVSAAGIVTTIAGTGTAGFSGDNGPATAAQLTAPQGIALDTAGNVFVADTGNRRVRRIATDGTITTVAGTGNSAGALRDGFQATTASLNVPTWVALDAGGNLLVLDNAQQRLRSVAPDGIITTVAGDGAARFRGDGGPATAASLWNPAGLAVDASNNVYIADTDNFRVRILPAAAPTFARTPESLSFTVRAGDPPPPPQFVSLTSSSVGLPFRISTNVGNIRASAESLVLPATVTVTIVNTEALSPGEYRGAITFTPTLNGIPALTTAVTLTVLPPAPPQLSAPDAGLAFTLVAGGASASRVVTVSNAGGGTVNFNTNVATARGGAWLTVNPESGSATAAEPASITITADPSALGPGTYSGVVGIAGAGSVVRIPVTLTVSSAGQSLRLSQTGLTFTAVTNGGATPPQSIAILASGQGSLAFTARAIVPDGLPAWLRVTPESGSTDTTAAPSLILSVDPSGLAPGDYYARVQVRAPVADNSPQEATVVLNVLAEGSDPGPIVQPTGLVFTTIAGGDARSQQVTVTNLSSTSLQFGSGLATVNAPNLVQYQPAAAGLDPGSLRLVVQPNFTGLAPGIYRGAITLVFSNGSIRTIALLAVIAPDEPKSSLRRAGSCVATRLLPLITSLDSSFRVPASWPATLDVRVVDDCAQPITSGSVVASFSNGDPPLALRPLGDGGWTGTWLVRNASLPQVTIGVSAESSALKGTIQATGGFSAGGEPPLISPGRVFNAPNISVQSPLSPGAMLTLYGSRLSSAPTASPAYPLERTLGETSVIAAGELLPLFESSDGQLKAVMPFGSKPNTRVQVVVMRGARISLPEEIAIAATQPEIFTVDGSGRGQAQAFVASGDTPVLANPANPAKPGDLLTIRCSGLGLVDQAIPDGAAAPDQPVAAVTPVVVTIGDVEAQVRFAGLAPGLAGLYLVQAVIPDSAPAGTEVPLQITSAGQRSAAVTIAISRP